LITLHLATRMVMELLHFLHSCGSFWTWIPQ